MTGPAPSPPAGLEWLHEIKHDRYRMIATHAASLPRGGAWNYKTVQNVMARLGL